VTPAQLASPNALLFLDGNFRAMAGFQPWTVFNDLRIAKRISFGERYNMDFIADMFNLANVYNVAAVTRSSPAPARPRPPTIRASSSCAETELVESERARTGAERTRNLPARP